MGWSLDFFSVKVLVLLFILLVFLVISLVIVLLEFKIKKRQKQRFTEEVENTRLAKLTHSLKKSKTLHQRLEVLDRHAKSLFRERHNITTNRSYSELMKIFDEKKAYDYSAFCKNMFEAYYSDSSLSDQKVKELLKHLTRLIRETEVYLDPEKYNVDHLYPKEASIEKKLVHSKINDKEATKLQKQQELITQKENSLKSQQDLLVEKSKTINEKERELSKKEKANQKLLFELEQKINIQEQKIKQQEELQKRIEEKLQKDQLQKQEILTKETKSKELERELKSKSEKEHWRDKIEVKTVVGKEWLKERLKGGRKKNR